MENISRIHWPAMLCFTLTIMGVWSAVSKANLADGLFALAFVCFGIYSLRNESADLFSQDIKSLFVKEPDTPKAGVDRRIEISGILLLFFGALLHFL